MKNYDMKKPALWCIFLVCSFLVDMVLFASWFFFPPCIAIVLLTEFFKDELDFLYLYPILFFFFIERFMMVGHYIGMPVLYVVPLFYGARWVKATCHLSWFFYPLFLVLLMFFDSGCNGFLVGCWGFFNLVF